MSEEIKATVIQASENSYLALSNQFPGLTGEGETREACIEDLTAKIEAYREAKAKGS